MWVQAQHAWEASIVGVQCTEQTDAAPALSSSPDDGADTLSLAPTRRERFISGDRTSVASLSSRSPLTEDQ